MPPVVEEEEHVGGFADVSDEEVEGFGSLSEDEEETPTPGKIPRVQTPKPAKRNSKRADKAMSAIAADWNSSAAQMGATFYVRSNVHYNGDMDPDPPPHTLGVPLKFHPRDFLQVFKVLNDDWWIGRLVGGGAAIGLIPSPSNLEKKLTAFEMKHKDEKAQSVFRRVSSMLSVFAGGGSANEKGAIESDVEAGEDKLSWKEKEQNYEHNLGKIVLNSDQDHLKGHNTARQAFRRPDPTIEIYDNAPRTRPVVFVGPSKVGCPVTDQLQRALLNYLQVVFPQIILEAPVHEWKNSAGKTSRGGFRPNPEAKVAAWAGEIDKTVTDASEVVHPEDLKFAKKHFYDDQLTVFRIDPEDITRIRHSSLMPCVIMIQIVDDGVLGKLIKECGTGVETRSTQIKSAEVLHKMGQTEYDLVLTDSNLRDCCFKLQAYLDMMLGESTFEISDTGYSNAEAAAAAEAASVSVWDQRGE